MSLHVILHIISCCNVSFDSFYKHTMFIKQEIFLKVLVLLMKNKLIWSNCIKKNCTYYFISYYLCYSSKILEQRWWSILVLPIMGLPFSYFLIFYSSETKIKPRETILSLSSQVCWCGLDIRGGGSLHYMYFKHGSEKYIVNVMFIM